MSKLLLKWYFTSPSSKYSDNAVLAYSAQSSDSIVKPGKAQSIKQFLIQIACVCIGNTHPIKHKTTIESWKTIKHIEAIPKHNS